MDSVKAVYTVHRGENTGGVCGVVTPPQQKKLDSLQGNWILLQGINFR